MTLEISQEHVQQISAHSRQCYPIEACGVLIGTLTGDVRAVLEVWPAENRLLSESSYEIDPETLFHAFAHAEQNRLEVVGFYHSHPFWSADASWIDRERANYPGLSYLIFSVPGGEIESFHLEGKQLIRESVKITET